LKWQAAAQEVLSRHYYRSLLTYEIAEQARHLVLLNKGYEAFHLAGEKLTTPGWNKFWKGQELVGWFGEIATIEPLRLIALEIESESLYAGWANKSEGALSEAIVRLLSEFIVPPVAYGVSDSRLALLRRINLDRRESPIIERWRWSSGAGTAFLSDGGRIQIKPALVWARAIEAILDEDGRLVTSLGKSLIEADPAQDFLALGDARNDPLLSSLVDHLSFFGFGKYWEGGVKLNFPLGAIPGQIARLFMN
jgi:hypothetical protein